jgi:CheY-like chemotaxis protein
MKWERYCSKSVYSPFKRIVELLMNKKRILVVDDNELFRDSIIETLRRQDYETEAAKDGQSALDIVEQRNFDLVISDMKMPGMSGIELMERIKSINPEIPF